MSATVTRLSAAGAAIEVLLSFVARVHGRLFGLRPEAYLAGAAFCLAITLLAVTGFLHGDSAKNKDKKKDQPKDEVAALIEQLGDDEFDTREQATKRLSETSATDTARNASPTPPSSSPNGTRYGVGAAWTGVAKLPTTNTAANASPSTAAAPRSQSGVRLLKASDATPRPTRIDATRAATFHLS